MPLYFDTIMQKSDMATQPFETGNGATAAMGRGLMPQSAIWFIGYHHDCIITSEISPRHLAILTPSARANDDCPLRMLEHPRDDRLEGKAGRVSTAVVQRFCKPKVAGSIPSPGTTPQGSATQRPACRANAIHPIAQIDLMAAAYHVPHDGVMQ